MPPFTPVELATIQEPPDPQIEGDDDDTGDLPPVPVAEDAATPKRQRRRPAKPPTVQTVADPTPAPVQVAAAPGPDAPVESASVIGELTPGADQDPKAQQDAADLIASNEKRLNALSPDVVKSQAALVSNARNFQKQAQQALRSGDAGGAKTLATKGKLLLDDLEKDAGR